jgi:hypothetical protein
VECNIKMHETPALPKRMPHHANAFLWDSYSRVSKRIYSDYTMKSLPKTMRVYVSIFELIEKRLSLWIGCGDWSNAGRSTSIATRQSLRPALALPDTFSSTIRSDCMSLWGIRPRMRYMPKNEEPITLWRLQQYTFINPIFCLGFQ